MGLKRIVIFLMLASCQGCSFFLFKFNFKWCNDFYYTFYMLNKSSWSQRVKSHFTFHLLIFKLSISLYFTPTSISSQKLMGPDFVKVDWLDLAWKINLWDPAKAGVKPRTSSTKDGRCSPLVHRVLFAQHVTHFQLLGVHSLLTIFASIWIFELFHKVSPWIVHT